MRGLYVPHNSYVNVSGADLNPRREGRVRRAGGQSPRPPESPICWPTATPPSGPFRAPIAPPTCGRRALSDLLLATERAWPPTAAQSAVVVMTPGVYTRLYEHAFLARLMGTPLVEGRDLLVTTTWSICAHRGLRRVDVIYRRGRRRLHRPSPFAGFRPGAAGLFNAYRAGNVVIANAPAPASPTTRRSMPIRPRSFATIWRKSRSCRSSKPSLPRAQPTQPRPGQSRQAGSQGGRRIRRLWHAGRAHATAKERAAFAEGVKATPTTTSPSRPSSFRPRPASWTGGSSPGTWTCVLRARRAADRGHAGALTRVALKRGSLVVIPARARIEGHWVLADGRPPHDARPRRRQPLLDRPLRGTGRAYQPAFRRHADRDA